MWPRKKMGEPNQRNISKNGTANTPCGLYPVHFFIATITDVQYLSLSLKAEVHINRFVVVICLFFMASALETIVNTKFCFKD